MRSFFIWYFICIRDDDMYSKLFILTVRDMFGHWFFHIVHDIKNYFINLITYYERLELILLCMYCPLRSISTTSIISILFLLSSYIIIWLKLLYTLIAIFFLVSCSGSEVHLRNVDISLANWLWVAGVPSLYSIIYKYKGLNPMKKIINTKA